MKLALGMRDVTEDNLQFAKQIGVTDLVIAGPDLAAEGDYFDYARTVQLISRVEAAGLRLAALQNMPHKWYQKIIYGLPGRDEQIENYIRSITNVGKACPSCTITFTRSASGAPAGTPAAGEAPSLRAMITP
jgi:mannonate dehydratase